MGYGQKHRQTKPPQTKPPPRRTKTATNTFCRFVIFSATGRVDHKESRNLHSYNHVFVRLGYDSNNNRFYKSDKN